MAEQRGFSWRDFVMVRDVQSGRRLLLLDALDGGLVLTEGSLKEKEKGRLLLHDEV